MDHIIEADGGIIRYPSMRSAITERIFLEMTDPKVQVFRNLRQMNFAQLKHFDPEDPGKNHG